MKYRQETSAERDCDGEFDTYDEWGKIWASTPIPECSLSRCARSALYYLARFCSSGRGWGIPGDVFLEHVRDVNADR